MELKSNIIYYRKLSIIEQSIISSFNKLVKSRKSNSIDNNEEFIPYYKSYLKNNSKLNSSLIIKRKNIIFHLNAI